MQYNKTAKVRIKDLANILEVSEKTASKEYKILLSIINTKRSFLVFNDLYKLEILCN